MISCILLCAGESRRFGSPKALAKINNREIISTTQENLLNSRIDDIIIILGAHANTIEPFIFNHKKIRIVYNKNHILGQTSSVQTGCAHIDPNSNGILLIPIDYPFILSTTINQLITQFNPQTKILIPTYKTRRGHPPMIRASLKEEILSLPTNCGINTLFKKYTPIELAVNDPGILATFNTPQELHLALRATEHHPD